MLARVRIGMAIDRQRGRLVLWVPVCLAVGIGLWFGLRWEPGRLTYAVVTAAALALCLVRPVLAQSAAPLATGLALVAAGFLLAGQRAHSVAAPQLDFRLYGPIEGRIVGIDRSVSDKVRLTLDAVWIADLSPERTPGRVRITLHGDDPPIAPEPGAVVMLTGHLSPPTGPAEPGGFDFQRMAWFRGIGAVGYTRSPVLLRSPPAEGAGLAVFGWRMRLSDAMRERIGGEAGAFAAAITTGDRSAISRETLDHLRRSNLAHLLAISGLHMGLLTGFLYTAIRFGLAAIPPVALRLPCQKIAAVCALAAGAGYLALSGGNVATERAFIMVAVMFGAVLVGRRALTLRAVAVAAVIVLARRPEELLGPGFQMSFAATTALVLVFGQLRGLRPRLLGGAGGVVISSLVAGLATAPFAAAHFNLLSHYGLLANVLSVPVMGAVVMPAAVAAACLAPLGLSAPALWVMEVGLGWILGVAATVSDWPGAVSHVATPPTVVLPALALGALTLALWRGAGRLAGPALIVAAFGTWVAGTRPPLLVSPTGGLMGLMTETGRSLSKPRGDGFAAGIWLENDGRPVPQADAADRDGIVELKAMSRAPLGQQTILQVRGSRAEAALTDCGGAAVVILTAPATRDRPCEVYDPARLRRTGALALWPRGDGVTVVTARDRSGTRLWNAGGGQ